MASNELINVEAESLTLAAFLRYPEDYWGLNSVGIGPDDLIGSENRTIMKAVSEVVDKKKAPMLPLVVEELRVFGDETSIDYAVQLTQIPVSVAQAHEYARTVKGLAASRRLAEAGAHIIKVARENRADYDSAIAEAESVLRKVRQSMPVEARSPDPADILGRLMTKGVPSRIPILFSPTLNDISGGLIPGQLWVIGGFSSVGKSAVASNIMTDAMRVRDKWAMLISTEMTSETYMVRLLAILSGVPQRVIRDRVYRPMDDYQSVEAAASHLQRANFRIYDNVYRLNDIRSKALRMKETLGLDLLIVDFIQNVHVTGDEISDARVTAIELQAMAKDLDCTVIAFSQVSNEQAKYDIQGGDDNYYSFKGSGAIKDAADMAVMLRRNRMQKSRTLMFKVVKNRHGETGVRIEMDMDLETGRIREAEENGHDDDD